MSKVNIKEARSQLRTLLNRVAAGEEVVIQRRGKDVARLVPPVRTSRPLPDLSGFRASLQVRGEALSRVVARRLEEERY